VKTLTEHQRLFRRAERFIKKVGAPMYADALPSLLADFGVLVIRSVKRKRKVNP
jgi:hypothetical protein